MALSEKHCRPEPELAGRPLLCEHVFVSIKGRASTWLESAIRRRDVASAMAEAAQMRPLSLEYALALTVLLAEARDPRFNRAAARWIARFALESPGVGLHDIEAAVVAFARLPHRSHEARELLGELARRHGLRVRALT